MLMIFTSIASAGLKSHTLSILCILLSFDSMDIFCHYSMLDASQVYPVALNALDLCTRRRVCMMVCGILMQRRNEGDKKCRLPEPGG